MKDKKSLDVDQNVDDSVTDDSNTKTAKEAIQMSNGSVNGEEKMDTEDDVKSNKTDADDSKSTHDKNETTMNGDAAAKNSDNEETKNNENAKEETNDVTEAKTGEEKSADKIEKQNGSEPCVDLTDEKEEEKKKPEKKVKDEFEDVRPMAKFLAHVGLDLCKETLYKELIKVQTRKKANNKLNEKEEKQLVKLHAAHEDLVQQNKELNLERKYPCTAERCNFRSGLIAKLDHHLDFVHEHEGHMVCPICPTFRTKLQPEFTFHMEAEHQRKAKFFPKLMFFNCPLCTFECNGAVQMKKHLAKCEKNFKLRKNLEPTPQDNSIPLIVPVSAPAKLGKMPRGKGGPLMVLPKGSTKPIGLPPGTIQVTNPLQPGQQVFLVNGVVYNLKQVNSSYQLVPIVSPAFTPEKIAQIQSQAMMQNLTGSKTAAAAAAPPKPTPPLPALKPGNTVAAQKAAAAAAAAGQNVPVMSAASLISGGPKNDFQVCEVCGGYVKDRESLRIHLFWAHKVDIKPGQFEAGNMNITCSDCSHKFWTYQGLARHRQTVHRKMQKKSYTCYVCKMSGLTHLLQHMSSSHGINLQTMFRCKKCFVCGEDFNKEKALELHLLGHHDDLFQASGTAKKKAEERAKQRKGSKKGFFRQKAAVAHNLSKAKPPKGDKKAIVPCTICNVWFATIEEFSDHCNTKHIFRCPRCLQKFTNKEARNKHVVENHKDEKEDCPLCRDQFGYGKEYTSHMLKTHTVNCAVRLEKMQEEKSREASSENDLIILDSPTKSTSNGSHDKIDNPSSAGDDVIEDSDFTQAEKHKRRASSEGQDVPTGKRPRVDEDADDDEVQEIVDDHVSDLEAKEVDGPNRNDATGRSSCADDNDDVSDDDNVVELDDGNKMDDAECGVKKSDATISNQNPIPVELN